MPLYLKKCTPVYPVLCVNVVICYVTNAMMFLLSSHLFRDWLGFALKPLLRQLIRVEVVVCLVPDLSMVVVHPLKLGIAQQGWLNQVAANGCHSNMLEA